MKEKIGFFEIVSGSLRENGIVYLTAAALGAVAGCAESPEDPSKYCCEAKKCTSSQTCDGEGDDCYCREETCCEKITCVGDASTRAYCKTNEWDESQCKCVYEPKGKGY